ncbi:phosphotransferase family protein [Nannocystaceae bacterium ST9]
MGLEALAEADLRPLERGRFATSIVRHLGELFDVAQVRRVASMTWPSEIGMVLRSQAPIQGDFVPATSDRLPVAPTGLELRELSLERGSPPTVVFMGDEDEHRTSMDQLRGEGIHCLRESSLQALSTVFVQEAVVGLIVGASWWNSDDLQRRSPRQRLHNILCMSNLCWMKLVRAIPWASLQDELLELCMDNHFAHPIMSRFSVEDHATITSAELRCITYAAQDIFFAERSFSYSFPLYPAQDRLLRAASSRYIREKFPSLHTQELVVLVRSLADRNLHGLATLVSVKGTSITFIVKVSLVLDAQEEARRFRLVSHGTSLEMDFFCHGMYGALVFAPINTRFGDAKSLDEMLTRNGHATPSKATLAFVDSAITVLKRFPGIRTGEVRIYCGIDLDDSVLEMGDSIVVAGNSVDLRKLYAYGRETLENCESAIVHGDAHPGNILFDVTDTAVLIDYECVGLGPACYDLCLLWVHMLASRFIAVADEDAIVDLLVDLLSSVPFSELEIRWSEELRFTLNREVVYLAHRSLEASFAIMDLGGRRMEVYGVVAFILCREFANLKLQQFVIRCALAAISAVIRDSE